MAGEQWDEENDDGESERYDGKSEYCNAGQ
jgi:hypothetical protein